MAEGQPPRETPMPRRDSLPAEFVEQIQTLQQFPGRLPDDALHVAGADLVRDDERQVELGGRCYRDRAEPTSGFGAPTRPVARGVEWRAAQSQLDAKRGARPHRSIELDGLHRPDALTVH